MSQQKSFAPFSPLSSRKLYCLLIALDLSSTSEQAIKQCVELRGATFIKISSSTDWDLIATDNEGDNVNFIIIAHGNPNSDGSIYFTRSSGGIACKRKTLLNFIANKFPKADSIGVYAGVCGGAIGSSSVGVDRVDYSGISFDVTTVDSVIDWVNRLGLRVE